MTPSISLIITFGLETSNSKPSLLIFSIKIDKCNSPLPETIHDSELGILSIFNETSLCVSLNKRSSIFLAVKRVPSLPENGEEFVPNVICKVGSSIRSKGKGLYSLKLQIVSPTHKSGNPAIAHISPAEASSISSLFNPKKPYNFWILKFFVVPSKRQQVT